MASTHRIAVIQWHIKVGASTWAVPELRTIEDMQLRSDLLTVSQELDPEYNHATACNYISEAAAQGAELAVLPE